MLNQEFFYKTKGKTQFLGQKSGVDQIKNWGKLPKVAGAEILQVLKINMLFLRARKNT